MTRYSQRKGFTLIELLIVVAIIGILAAIAIPNFLLAQVRAKVSRVRAEMSSLATALEQYYVDNNHYPYYEDPSSGLPPRYNEISYRLIQLTSPIRYIRHVDFHDPFLDVGVDSYQDGVLRHCYNYRNHEFWSSSKYPEFDDAVWVLNGIGPDQSPDHGLLTELWARDLVAFDYVIVYDPTNGTISQGDMPRTGGETRFHD